MSPDAITFGQVAVLRGPAAALGKGMRAGILAAFAEANKNGGVSGRQLKLISSDDGYEPQRSIEATKELIAGQQIFAFVGAVGTPTSLASEPIAVASKFPFIGAFTGAEFLRTPYNPLIANVRASYNQETEAMVEWLTAKRKIQRVAILYQDDAFGRAGLDGTRHALQKRKMQLVSQGAFERNTTAVKLALLKIRAGQPEAVIMIGAYKPCAAFIKVAKSLGMTPLFLNISFVGSEALSDELGSDADGVFVTQVVPLPYDRSQPLVARYQAALEAVSEASRPGFVSLEGYLAGRLVVESLSRIHGDPTREGLLSSLTEKPFDFDGFVLSYSDTNNQGSSRVYLTELRPGGQFRNIDLERTGEISAASGALMPAMPKGASP